MVYLNNNTTTAQNLVFPKSGREVITQTYKVRIFNTVTMAQVRGGFAYDDSYDSKAFNSDTGQLLTAVGKGYYQAVVTLARICDAGEYVYVIVDAITDIIVNTGMLQMPSVRSHVPQGNPANLLPTYKEYNPNIDISNGSN